MIKKKYKNREDETLRGYVKLVQAMLINVYDRIRIKDSWQSKELSQRMLNRKFNDLNQLGAWLHTDGCAIWFNILSQCTSYGSRKMYETFIKTHAKSMEFMKEHPVVDKPAIDSKISIR